MKTNIISKWAALLLTFSGMAAFPLTLSAQNLVVSNSAHPAETGASYSSTTASNAALQVTGSLGSYSGTNITITSTVNIPSMSGGVWANNRSSVSLTGGSISTTGSQSGALLLTNTSNATLTNVNIQTTGNYIARPVQVLSSSTLTMTGGTIASTGSSSIAVTVSGLATAIFDNVTVRTEGNNAHAFFVNGNGNTLTATGGGVTTSGSRAIGVLNDGANNVTLTNASINTTGANAYAVYVGSTNNSLTTLNNVSISTNADSVMLTSMSSGTKTLVIDGGSITSQRSAITANETDRLHNLSTLSNFNGTYDVTVKGGATLTGSAAVTANTTWTGTNPGSGSIEEVEVPLILNLNVSEASTLNGDVNLGDSATANINLDGNSVLLGNINAGDDLESDTILTVSLRNSSSMAGDIATSGTGSVTLNMDSHARYTGDIFHESGGALALNLTADSSGKGNWQHGNLTMDATSKWEFTSGTSVIDNLNNDGELIFDVNTDDGSHATLNVTGTASGSGQLNVNVTGTTQITEDQKNDILNNLVTGSAQGSWNFDNGMDWGGLIEEEVVVGPDGSLYLKPNGKLNTAGNIATGLVAAQKGSWFAQQNSLLKRMGEIRLLNDAYNQTLAGKNDDKTVTLSAKNIIDNVWIRAYGQQLNFNASVTGQAFKQYVYGTDIGTDHKFTLNNSSVLYTGIFAGYGAADTDHKHNGSKSDISNYYAGLYGSWLNNSGWYADATLKAQYTNNTLNGSNGMTSFNGSYHNWSVGGSIELGKQFKFQDDWFIEPQFQANYVHILASDYTLSQGLNVNVSDLDAFQLRLGVVAGRTLKLKNGGTLQPYVKLSGVEMLSTGGKLTAMGNTVRPNLDGARAELGAGIIWQVDANNQLHLDYEASFGDKYDKPWGLTAGYRYQF